MKNIMLVTFFMLTSFSAMSFEWDLKGICESYQDSAMPISRQHRYVKRTEYLSCRLGYRVKTQWRLYIMERKKGKLARELVKDYRNAIKDLHACTNFSYDNTYEDRVIACEDKMTATYSILYKLSDILTSVKYLLSDNAWYVLVHNRRGLDLIIGQTAYPWPTRSWWDWGEPFPE